MNDNDTSLDESLEEDARTANSNLIRLIEAVGALLSASTDVLTRVQGILGGNEPTSDIAGDRGRNVARHMAGSDHGGNSPPPANPSA